MTAVFYLRIKVFFGQFAYNKSLQFVVGKLRQGGMINLNYEFFMVD